MPIASHRGGPLRPARQVGTALLVVDLINPMDFDGADDLFGPALLAAERIVAPCADIA